MSAAVHVDRLWKTYRLYQRPVDRLLEALTRRPRHAAVHSLRDVSFTLATGETLGLIGTNGAGKSTLLKVLAGTLSPTSGLVRINGRATALLELGSGFHPEFTGRQNIALNASLLGLSPEEITRREQEIIAFAELEDVIDRPLKTYSSGMVMRLGFSVATSVDPDVLIVDEALSVGDQRFQRKCVERMQGFRQAGKTIIVCSHSMYLINELCREALWLEAGQVCAHGRTAEIVSRYLAAIEDRRDVAKDEPVAANRDAEVQVEAVEIVGPDGQPATSLAQFAPVDVLVRTRRRAQAVAGHLAVALESPSGQTLFSALTRPAARGPVRFSGRQEWRLRIPRCVLQQGEVQARGLVTDEHALHLVDQNRSASLPVVSEHPEFGLVWMEHEWILPPDH